LSRYIGSVDQGTTSSRFIVFDRKGDIVALDRKEHAQIYPKPGWVEHDALEIWRNTQSVISGALSKAGLAASDLAAIGITNQRETTLIWDRRSGQPLHNAIVWQDTRTDRLVAEFARRGGKDRLRAKTGLPLATYFSGLKLRWLLDGVPGARAKAEAGDVLFGNIDSWLMWNLTGGVKGGIHVFGHAACIAANVEMSSLFEPIPKLLGILDHAMLHVDLEILVPRKSGIEPSQHTFALVRFEFFLIEKVAARLLGAKEEPIAAFCACRLPFLKKRTERRDARTGPDHYHSQITVLGWTKVFRGLHKDRNGSFGPHPVGQKI